MSSDSSLRLLIMRAEGPATWGRVNAVGYAAAFRCGYLPNRYRCSQLDITYVCVLLGLCVTSPRSIHDRCSAWTSWHLLTHLYTALGELRELFCVNTALQHYSTKKAKRLWSNPSLALRVYPNQGGKTLYDFFFIPPLILILLSNTSVHAPNTQSFVCLFVCLCVCSLAHSLDYFKRLVLMTGH